MRRLRLATRGSALALWQARAVAHAIGAGGGPECEILVITTTGDRLAEAKLAAVGGKRLFVKEIEDALIEGTADLAVHSAKDLPSDLPSGLAIGAVLPREDPSDAIVLPAGVAPAGGGSVSEVLTGLGAAPRIATSSVRRAAQLRPYAPRAVFAPIRGNLDTRLRKLDGGAADALILAVAGLRRLGFENRVSVVVPVDTCVPAPGQGIIAVEVRTDDREALQAVGGIDDAATSLALRAERALVAGLGGGCQLPIGALARMDGGQLELLGVVTSVEGSHAVRARETGAAEEASALGARLAQRLLTAGAAAILEALRS